MKIFYVCTYGGCGSKMLCKYLSNFGKTVHIQSKKPPVYLEYVGKPAYTEWFNGRRIPTIERKRNRYYIIYIYKHPVKSIYSRFLKPIHLKRIQSNPSITLNEVLESKKDLYGIENFFDNYVNKKINKDYKILCVKYEGLFDNVDRLNKYLGINLHNKKLFPPKKETKRKYPEYNELCEIYKPLIDKMDKMGNFVVV